MNQAEFEALIADRSKTIEGDIIWTDDEDHSPSVEFRAAVTSEPGYPLFVKGTYNRLALSLSFALIHRGVGRIYGLDLGKEHHNPDCNYVGEKHKHRWNVVVKDKEAYIPDEITATASEPVRAWEQFCSEAKIAHT